MYNKLVAVSIFIYRLVKKLIIWGSKVENLSTIKAQLDLISMGAKHFGVATKFKPFLDVADTTTTIAKTINDIIDGQEGKAKKEFIDLVNKDSKKLPGLRVNVSSKDGIGVNFNGLKGSYDPSNGSVKFGVSL